MYIIQKAQWQIKSCIFVVGYETVAFNYVIEDLLKCEKSKRKKSHVETVCISVTDSQGVFLQGQERPAQVDPPVPVYGIFPFPKNHGTVLSWLP